MELYNRVNREVLKQKLQLSDEKRVTISFYQYWNLNNPQLFRDHLYLKFSEVGVYGRIYVAKEGINAQISVPENNLEQFKQYLAEITFLNGIRLNVAVDDDGKSFYKLKIKVKEKILADGLNDESFDVTNKGKHLSAEEFNQLTDQDDTVLVDMRNHYETEVGHFENAICPDVDTFRDSLPIVEEILEGQKDKNLVMYCTGGIRCEKASAYFKHKGFENVYQLEGGIIKYAQDISKKGLKNKFKGKNFVFDERLGERISEEIISKCHQCGKPCDDHTNCKNEACNLLFLQCEECAEKYENCCSKECQEVIHLSEEKQKELRKQQDSGIRIFSKGRFKKSSSGLEKIK
ncbi:rhodanese-related sulfurtransferase [Rapidithrix thailandica]|uniref:tRNA uridine(34) hydroxylase n=1 Tax=Rapidithrix thailandica TaxID=413964 RepID=A0AAW9SF76_9BACT